MRDISKLLIIAVIICTGSFTVLANTNAPSAKPDITTLSGKTYTRCKITRVEPDGIRIFHATGVAKIPFADLPEDFRKKHGYDAEKSAAYQSHVRKRQAAAAAHRQKQRENERVAAAHKKAATPVVQKLKYAGQFDIAQAKENIAKLNGKVIQLSFKSVADIIETQEGYETTMFNSIFRSSDSIGISARFPGLAAGWLSSLPKTKYRREGRISVGDMFESQHTKGRTFSVFGKITGTGALRLEPLGTRKTGSKYSW